MSFFENRYASTETTTHRKDGAEYTIPRTTTEYHTGKMILDGCIALLVLIMLFGSIYTVEEGHIGIKKRFSEAVSQVSPGLHFKMPFIDSVTEIEVRTRKNEEKMQSSTSEQMPVTVSVSVNWTVDKTAALELYREYGGLAQFESRILDPRFRSEIGRAHV